MLLVSWDKDGVLTSRSIHQYGGATLEKTSSPYAEQSRMFVNRELKPFWMDAEDIRANLEREYYPGEGIGR